jgi:hypothetical protein
MKAVNRVPSRITVLEGNMDWLVNTPFLSKRAGFFIIGKKKGG